MTRNNKSERLATRLMRRLIWVAGAVLIADITFVTVYEASDRDALLADVVTSEIINLDLAILAAADTSPQIKDAIDAHFANHPTANG